MVQPAPSSTPVKRVSRSLVFFEAFSAIAVFGSLGLAAFYYLHVQQASVGLDRAFEPHCPSSGGEGIGIAAYRAYTGHHGFDLTLCMIVNMFDTLLRPPLRLVNVPFLLSLPAAWYTATLEATALFPESRALAIGFPLVLGLVAQVLGGAVAFPVYWMTSVLLRLNARTKSRPLARPDPSAMTGVVLGIMLGVAPITIAMIIWPTQLNITLWQFVPFYLTAIQLAVMPFFLHHHHRPSGNELRLPHARIHTITQVFFIACALVATPGHLPFLRAVISSSNPTEMLVDAFIPYPYPYRYRSSRELMMFGPENEAKRFIQWDVIFIFISAWLGGVWSWAFSNMSSFLLAISATALATTVLGPGAFLVAPYMVQAWMDENRRRQWAGSLSAKKAQ